MSTEAPVQPQTQTPSETRTAKPAPTKHRARMRHPVFILPEALTAMRALNKATEVENLPFVTRKLVDLRASQINGCSVCVDMHAKELKQAGQSDERIYAVGAWRDTPYFTDAERAALALTEHVTRLSDRPDPVPDDIWAEAARHYDEKALAALVISIAAINVWNRLNVSVKQMVGASWH
jgi:AhpD family alkylhydroperoxidase